MTQAIALFKKEFLEFSRNYKLLIIICVFFFFAFGSPLAAKFMPTILSEFLPKEVADSFPAPSAFDSWEQFFKNISQLGLFVIVLIFGSTLASERQSGTLIILLTKGLSRKTVIIVKFIFAVVVWTVSYVSAFIITFAYTKYYWPDDIVDNLFLAIFLLWLFGLLLIAFIILGNVLFRSLFSTLLFILGALVVLFILSLFPKLENIALLRFISENNAILHGQFDWADYFIPIGFSFGLTLAMIVLAIQLFNRKSL